MNHQIRPQKCNLERRIWKSSGSDSIEDCVRESADPGRLRKQHVLTPVLALATALEIELQGMKETETGLFVGVAQWLECPPILGFIPSRTVICSTISQETEQKSGSPY